MSPAWSVHLRPSWDVLGPFPIRAREQHLLFPGFPLRPSELNKPFEPTGNVSWPSSLADGGSVHWSTATQNDDGHLSVSFPDVRWAALRATEGWAALQHHALLHTTLTVSPSSLRDIGTAQPHLLVNSVQSSFFAILPQDRDESSTAEWHASNIYAYPHVPKQAIPLPRLQPDQDTTFDVFISADYEIRLFGDPHNNNREVPVIEIDFNVQLEDEDDFITRDTHLDVAPDFVDGFAFGSVFGFGLRSLNSHDTWEIVSARISDVNATLAVAATHTDDKRFHLAPLQSRVYVVRIEQEQAFDGDTLNFDIDVHKSGMSVSHEHHRTLHLAIPVSQLNSASFASKESPVIHATHILAASSVKFLAVPPAHDSTALPIVYLHGAGVEIDNPELPTSLPRQPRSWIMYPSGRTSWGYDWHGPSARHVLAVAPALQHILSTHPTFSSRPVFAPDSRIVLVGHSNGGQGTWFVAARNPDRVAAMMAAAAYSKSQSYVSWAMERGAHYSDPLLGAVLKASMTGDDNDLFLSNLVDKPVLGLHGGADENVPTWHTRELVSVLRTLSTSNSSHHDVNFVEMPGKPHWYPGYFDAVPEAQAFLDSAVRLPADPPSAPIGAGRAWTFTVAWPHESGSMYGFKVLELDVPGKLARLTVEMPNAYSYIVRSSNVFRFSFPITRPFASAASAKITVDRTVISYAALAGQLNADIVTLQKTNSGSWKLCTDNTSSSRPLGPLSHALDTSSTVKIIIPDPPANSKCHSAATRLAHTLLTYLALDVEILSASEATSKQLSSIQGTRIIISVEADERNSYEVKHQGSVPFSIERGKITIEGYVLDEPSIGALLAHPQSIDGCRDRAVYITGTNADGLEQALRLFPFRTGIPVPEWIVVSEVASTRATGGILGAGFWDRTGSLEGHLKSLSWTEW